MAMMAGIMAIFEMGLSITGQSLILKPPLADDYQEMQNELKELDKSMYSLLYNENEEVDLDPLGSPRGEPLTSSDLCAQLLCRISRNGSGFCMGEDGLPPAPPAVEELLGVYESNNSPSGDWSDSCALELSKNSLELSKKYRWLIRPEPLSESDFPYQLFSCGLNYEGLKPDLIKCNFESSL